MRPIFGILRRSFFNYNRTQQFASIACQHFNPPNKNFVSIRTYMDFYDVFLIDIDNKVLRNTGIGQGIPNLSEAEFPESSFPIKGTIHRNGRLLIPLFKDPSTTINTMRALLRTHEVSIPWCSVSIQEPNTNFWSNLSHSRFAEANILGTNVMEKLGLSIYANWKKGEFSLVKEK